MALPSRRPLPRLLPLHLMLARARCPSSFSGWNRSSAGWPLSSTAPPLQPIDEFFSGLRRYREAPPTPPSTHLPAAATWGTTRLLDYGVFCPDAAARPILVIPSLINRAYVLDMDQRHSFLRFLCARGYRPLLMDWGEPGAEEQSFSLSDYITRRLEAALSAACQYSPHPLPVMGYCMGGLLALALAQRRPRDVSRLLLLATPWDFHAAGTPAQRQTLERLRPAFLRLCQRHRLIQPDVLQYLLLGVDPYSVVERFTQFGRHPQEDGRPFIAVEEWLNDGVPLSAQVAMECLFSWYLDNTPLLGEWRVEGQAVRPAGLNHPALVVCAQRDRLVPPAASQALAALMPEAALLSPAAGHIGMVAGRNARSVLWEPAAAWLAEQPAD